MGATMPAQPPSAPLPHSDGQPRSPGTQLTQDDTRAPSPHSDGQEQPAGTQPTSKVFRVYWGILLFGTLLTGVLAVVATVAEGWSLFNGKNDVGFQDEVFCGVLDFDWDSPCSQFKAAQTVQYIATALLAVILVVAFVAAYQPAPATGKYGLAAGIALVVFSVLQLIVIVLMAHHINTLSDYSGSYVGPGGGRGRFRDDDGYSYSSYSSFTMDGYVVVARFNDDDGSSSGGAGRGRFRDDDAYSYSFDDDDGDSSRGAGRGRFNDDDSRGRSYEAEPGRFNGDDGDSNADITFGPIFGVAIVALILGTVGAIVTLVLRGRATAGQDGPLRKFKSRAHDAGTSMGTVTV